MLWCRFHVGLWFVRHTAMSDCVCACAHRLVTVYRDFDGCSSRTIIRGNQIHNWGVEREWGGHWPHGGCKGLVDSCQNSWQLKLWLFPPLLLIKKIFEVQTWWHALAQKYAQLINFNDAHCSITCTVNYNGGKLHPAACMLLSLSHAPPTPPAAFTTLSEPKVYMHSTHPRFY